MNIVETTKKTFNKLTWTWNPGSEKEAGDAIVKNVMLHWFPNKINKASLSWNYSFYLGTISFVLFMILTLRELFSCFCTCLPLRGPTVR